MYNLIRAEKEHCDILYEWTNEEQVRKNSFSADKIPYEDHSKWFYSKISSEETQIYICLYEHIKAVGVIRLDKFLDGARISYSVEKEQRGKGIGKTMVVLLESKIIEENILKPKLYAEVKKDNLASQKIFKSLEYEEREESENLIYVKTLR